MHCAYTPHNTSSKIMNRWWQLTFSTNSHFLPKKTIFHNWHDWFPAGFVVSLNFDISRDISFFSYIAVSSNIDIPRDIAISGDIALFENVAFSADIYISAAVDIPANINPWTNVLNLK